MRKMAKKRKLTTTSQGADGKQRQRNATVPATFTNTDEGMKPNFASNLDRKGDMSPPHGNISANIVV
jgi:hypothetical protein